MSRKVAHAQAGGVIDRVGGKSGLGLVGVESRGRSARTSVLCRRLVVGVHETCCVAGSFSALGTTPTMSCPRWCTWLSCRMVRSPPLTEKHPEHCHRSDQRNESQERTCHCRNVCRSHQIVEAIEALLQRQCQQETGEQLHTGLCDSQLLEQVGPVASSRCV
jgi:hypothetical protein